MFPRLKERRGNFGNQLSGGEQQMLAIGRALTLNPKVLLLDEPTEGLAPIIVEELLRALGTITRAGGICSIIVEQNAQKILGLADRVVILERGAIVHDAASCRPESRSRGARTLSRRLGRRGTLNHPGVTTMQRTKAPFRADEVGSLLRPPRIKEARARLEKGEISADDLRKAEDIEIEKVVHRQASTGLKLATDGEFRRSWWHFDFLGQTDRLRTVPPRRGHPVRGRADPARRGARDRQARFSRRPSDARPFQVSEEACDIAHVMPKMTIPVAGGAAFPRRPQGDLESRSIPTSRSSTRISAKTYRKAVKAFYDAGCRYLQFDDTVWAYLCSQDELKKARERGDNPDGLQEIYARIINYAIAERPADMTITTHVCRGNFRSTWISSGGYEPVAETMLAGTNYDGYFLEYDSERAGGFEPLRFLPKGNKIVVVGVITSKSGALEKKDDIKRRLEEAAKYVPLDQLALSPQCGFASTEEGNLLTEEEQWAKLQLAVEVANEVWGK